MGGLQCSARPLGGRKGSGGMKGISTSPEQVAVWVNSFSMCAHIDIAMEHMYNEAGEDRNHTVK